jgi:hypothetical protein
VIQETYSNAALGRVGNWMQLASGKPYWPNDPRAEEVDILDIAAALSKICRYGGHCKKFYSVAEHSVYVSKQVPKLYALRALLHDATEAYVTDVPRPLKSMLGAGYADIEQKNWVAVCEAFGLPLVDPTGDDYVKKADNAVLLAEKDQIMVPSPLAWNVEGTAAQVFILGDSPAQAEALFLARYYELRGA